MSWEDQGRQEHGWFGNGTAPPKLTGQDALKHLDLDAASSADIAALRAYLWAKRYGPALFGLPRSGAALDGFAEGVMRLERAGPGSMARALGSDMLVRGSTVQPGSRVEAPASDERAPRISDGSEYSPSREGYHRYQAGPNVVCSAVLRCTAEEIADQMSRFAVPGRSPDHPVRSLQRYPVYAPITGRFVGNVVTTVSADGLIIQNVTRPGHLLYRGQITRTAIQNPDGSWSVTTIGVGNNIKFGMATANELAGPHIFDSLDEKMRENIERHHGAH